MQVQLQMLRESINRSRPPVLVERQLRDLERESQIDRSMPGRARRG